MATNDPCDAIKDPEIRDAVRTVCQKWTATRAFLVLSDVVGLLGLAFFGLTIWRGANGPKWHTYGAFSCSVSIAVFMFISMCLAVNLKGDNWMVAYGSGFIVAIISWIFGAIAAVGVPLTYKAMQ
ncbi:hypothetical protein HK101_003590 [Irineochytrium annulatum]|nr:hypothetical protein HK101_003590 [Irineochytrium annulatum]